MSNCPECQGTGKVLPLDPFPWRCVKQNGMYVGFNPRWSEEFNEFAPSPGYDQNREHYADTDH